MTKRNRTDKHKPVGPYKYETLATLPSDMDKSYDARAFLKLDGYTFGRIIEHDRLCHCCSDFSGGIKWETYIYEDDTWVSGCQCYDLTEEMIHNLNIHDDTLIEKIRIIVQNMDVLSNGELIPMRQITHLCHYFERYDRDFIESNIELLDNTFGTIE